MASDTAQQANSPAPNPGPGHRQGRWLKRLGIVAAAFVVVLFLVWLSFPAWATLLARHFVPDNWSLQTLKLDRPGLSGLTVQKLEARGQEAGLPLSLSAANAALSFKGLAVHIEHLEIGLRASTTSSQAAAFDLATFSIPRLLVPESLPQVRIDTLSLTDRRTANTQGWTFGDLTLGNEAQGLTIKTVIVSPAPLSSDLDLSLTMNGERVQLLAVSSDRPDTQLLRFEQQPSATDPTQALAQLQWDLDLDQVNAGQLAEMMALPEEHAPSKLGGTVAGQLLFRGTSRLQPESGELRLQNLVIEAPAASVDGDLDMDMDRSKDTVSVQLHHLSADIVVSGESLLRSIQREIAAQGLSGLLDGSELALSLSAPGVASDTAPEPAPFAIELGLNRPYLEAFSGTLRLGVSQKDNLWFAMETLQLSGATDPATPDKDALFVPGSWRADGAGSFSFARPVSFVNGDQTLGASAGSGAFSMTAQQTGGDESISASLEDFELLGVSAAQPGMTASLGSLSLSGHLSLVERLVFNGPIAGQNVVVASEDQPLAPPLLSAGSFSMEMNLAEQDDASTLLRGPLTLESVNLPFAAITADSVLLDLTPMELTGLDGKLRLLTTGLVAQIDGDAREGLDVDLNGDIRSGRYYDGDGELLLGYQATLPFRFAADLETSAGTVTFSQAVLPVAGLGGLAKPLGLTLPKNLGFDSGQLRIDGDVRSDADGISGSLTVAGEELGLSLGESSLEGLNFSTQLNLAEVLQGDGAVTLGLARLAAGLDLVSLTSELDINSSEEFGARSLTAQLLGGMISIPSLRLKAGQLQDARIQWEGFDLGRLLKFVDVNGLEGSGTMDARLPLVAEPAGPAVRNGSFAARGPGYLRYSSGVPAANIGLQALENFEYESLSGTLEYDSDGGYTIGVELLGANPELYGGYPIRFRLNLGGAMPALFRSLFITGDFEKGIIERLRAGAPLLEPPATEPLQQ